MHIWTSTEHNLASAQAINKKDRVYHKDYWTFQDWMGKLPIVKQQEERRDYMAGWLHKLVDTIVDILLVFLTFETIIKSW